MLTNRRGWRGTIQSGLILSACAAAAAQQLPAPATPPWVAVRPIAPPASPLPPEAASADATRFSFIAYGDTRSANSVPGDAEILNPDHSRVMDRILTKVGELAPTPFPVRFVLQSGDGVLRGQNGAMWNVGFSPTIERLTSGANVPYFFAAGNHDVGTMPQGDPARAVGLHNTLTAMSRLIPAEGSPRRLGGYLTYAFGYGNAFFIALDSNIASDAAQLAWAADQLEHLDRTRYRHVIAFFHHPPYSSGPHGGGSADPVPGTGVKAPDRVEPQTASIRALYMPLFRKHHVRLIVAGHDHLYDHWVERYDDNGVAYRLDTIVTGGGGAPLYGYTGEPDLRAYAAGAPGANIRIEHQMKPGLTPAENQYHFVVIQVDGDKLTAEVVGADADYKPYPGGVSKVFLGDKRSS